MYDQEKLPPTDSRLRPDQRSLENGEYDKANSEKLRLEQRQRQVVAHFPFQVAFEFYLSLVKLGAIAHAYAHNI